MGLGMGSTRMPIMSSALATLTAQNTARGSTLLNITQQVAASIGTALFSVILTNEMQSHASVKLARDLDEAGVSEKDIAGGTDRFLAFLAERDIVPEKFQALMAQVPADMASSFATVFVDAPVLGRCVLVQAFFLHSQTPAETVD